MPKLYENSIATKFGYNIDKKNDEVGFDDEKHVYFNLNTGITYISATQIIERYSQEFDQFFWTSYKALEAIMDEATFKILKKSLLATKKFNPAILKKFEIDQETFETKRQEISDEYDRKRKESTDRGTRIHAMFENSFYGKKKFNFSQFGYKDLDGEYSCKKDYFNLDLENGVFPEFLISLTSRDGLLRVCGQIDLLIKRGNDIIIVDFKTNREIKKESYYNRSTRSHEMMKFPLNNLMDTNYWHYALQLSLYAYLLQQLNSEFNIKSLRLIHIDHDDKQHEYEVPYLKEEIERMLKHYKKQLKIKQELDNLKPVIK